MQKQAITTGEARKCENFLNKRENFVLEKKKNVKRREREREIKAADPGLHVGELFTTDDSDKPPKLLISSNFPIAHVLSQI